MSSPTVNWDPNHPLTKALRDLVRDQKLGGAVLLTFTVDAEGDTCIGVNSSGCNPASGRIMTRVADEIFAHFAAGHYDGAVQDPN